eukprot:TRINITY_DN18915_c0_g1_i1.p1 TRINITY_DN18915_c0_g1~~TRINITY_DN18915_c0_g1_i1.p1  ORF type:complete len:469 (+),score=165.03 TRINITY_DN18915_c0_g1_i1:71-1408(+)
MVDDDDDMNFDEDDNGEEGGNDEDDDKITPETAYYNAKSSVEDSIKEALEQFQTVLDLERDEYGKGEWGFKALKKMIKIYLQKGDHRKVVALFKELLTYIKSAVSSNLSEKGVNTIVDLVSTSGNVELSQQMFEMASAALMEAKNTRVWFRVNLKLANILFDAKQFDKLSVLLDSLHKWCTLETGEDDPKKGAQLVDIYAMGIQLHQALHNTVMLKTLCKKALQFTHAIPHPRVLGVIRECSGMVDMEEKDYARANQDFFDAFKNYDEAGSPKRVQCLKYLVFARMIELSEINPFSSSETLPYKGSPDMQVMMTIYDAYEKQDIKLFELLVTGSGKEVAEDPFMCHYVPDLLRNVRSHVMLKIIKPYSRLHLPFISKEVGVPDDECERLLVTLILDGKVRGHIDQINKIVIIDSLLSASYSKYSAMAKWNRQLGTLRSSICAKLS